MSTDLEVHVTWRDGRAVLRATGEIDVRTADTLVVAAAAAADGHGVVIDMAGVTFIDSSGINALLQLRARHRRVVVDPMPACVRRLLDVAGITRAFESAETDLTPPGTALT